MSFLNPVNEPVLRFSSTDAGAPQINYNARVAGDVKAVLKACLVTGYGAKASAGWSAVNETATVAEFVSPSAAMSDYRLGIDDASASSTTWYYQYQDARVNPNYNAPTKNLSYINKTSAKNGWELFVTNKGFVFIELVESTAVADNTQSSRITYFSTIKSARVVDVGVGIAFFNIGHSAAIPGPINLLRANFVHINMAGYGVTPKIFTSLPFDSNGAATAYGGTAITLSSQVFIAPETNNQVIGLVPGIMAKINNDINDLYLSRDVIVNSRPMFECCAGIPVPNASAISEARMYMIATDYWEY